MLKGKCPGCGTEYYGWALRASEHQICDGCGVTLEITHNVRKPVKGSAPIEVEQFTVEPALETPSILEKEYCLQKL